MLIDPISTIWFILWVSIGSYGVYLLICDDKAASRFYVYGKSLHLIKKESQFWNLFLLPKRYFLHFYILATIIFLSNYYVIFLYYETKYASPSIITLGHVTRNILSKLSINLRPVRSIESITSLIFTVILMTIQTSRRLYETIAISVYSKDSKINIIHYAFGHFFYLMIALNNLVPILCSETSETYTLNSLITNLINKERSIIFVLFIYVSLCQNRSHRILADLRRDRTGNVISDKHYVPSGGLFEYVSCPHFMTEVIIYFLILVVQHFEILYWNLTFLLVVTTQTINALHEHRWYRTKYKEYPPNRKAIIPGLL